MFVWRLLYGHSYNGKIQSQIKFTQQLLVFFIQTNITYFFIIKPTDALIPQIYFG